MKSYKGFTVFTEALRKMKRFKACRKFMAFMMVIFIISSVSILGLQGVEEHWSYTFIRQLMDKQALSKPPASKEELDLYITKDEFLVLLHDNKLIHESLTENIRQKLYGFTASGAFVTREEACIILGDLLMDGYSAGISFSDLEEISPDARNAMQKLNYFYIIDGYPDGCFSPRANITKAEILKLITVMRKVPTEYFARRTGTTQYQQPFSVASVYIEVTDAETFSQSNDLPQVSYTTNISTPQPDMMTMSSTTQPDNQSAYNTPLYPTQSPNAVSLLMPLGDISVPDQPASLNITAKMGSSFRSLDVEISALNGNFSSIYYLAVEAGDKQPTQADIVSYINGTKNEGLTVGSSVRGKLESYFNDTKRELTLHGGEGMEKLKGETGFIDGYNYDLYMVGIDSDGRVSEIAEHKNVMAMPFDAADLSNKTYTIRSLSIKQLKDEYPDLLASSKYSEKVNHTARQLENIQRLADLYIETSGQHGDISFLTGKNTYVLDSDIDLAEYMSFDGEKGWKPLGGTGINEDLYFGGTLDGKSNKISNLYIDRDADLYGDKIACQGLFGVTKGATIMNVELDRANIIIRNARVGEAYIGTLAGHAVNSIISNVTVNSLSLKAFKTPGGAAGGVVGFADNTDIDGVTVNNAVISTKSSSGDNEEFSDYTGGVAGRFRDLGKANLFSNIFVSGVITASGKGAGGAAGIIECLYANHAVYAHNIDACINVYGDSENVGGIAGIVENKADESSITFENCYTAGSVTGKINIGGVFGVVRSTKSGLILKNSISEMDVKSDNKSAVIGGVVAHADGGSFESCEALGSTLVSKLMRIGGFAGYVTGDTSFVKCMSNKSIDANRVAGGFAGEVNGSASFIRCSSQGAVINVRGEDAGGFIGLQSGGNVMLSDCFSTNLVQGGENAGGLAGRIGANGSESEFVNCFSAGDITGTVNTGGFIGRLDNDSIIIDSYSTGKVDVDGNPGKFIGNRQSGLTE